MQSTVLKGDFKKPQYTDNAELIQIFSKTPYNSAS